MDTTVLRGQVLDPEPTAPPAPFFQMNVNMSPGGVLLLGVMAYGVYIKITKKGLFTP